MTGGGGVTEEDPRDGMRWRQMIWKLLKEAGKRRGRNPF